MFNKKAKKSEESEEKVTSSEKNSGGAFHRMFPLLLGAFSVIVAVCYIVPSLFGVVGHFIRDVFFGLFGGAAIAVPVFLLILAVTWRRDVGSRTRLSKWLSATVFVLLLGTVLFIAQIPGEIQADVYLPPFSFEKGKMLVGGGFFGNLLGYPLVSFINVAGIIVLFVLSILLLLVSFFNFDPRTLTAMLLKRLRAFGERRREEKERVAAEKAEEERVRAEQRADEERRTKEEASRTAAEREAAEKAAREEEARRLLEKSRRVMADTPDASRTRTEPLRSVHAAQSVSDTRRLVDIDGTFVGRTAADYPLDNDVFYTEKQQKEKVQPLRPIRKSNGLSGVDTSHDYLNRTRTQNVGSRESDLAAHSPRTLEEFASITTTHELPRQNTVSFSRENVGGFGSTSPSAQSAQNRLNPFARQASPMPLSGDVDINDIPVTEEGVVYSRRNAADIPMPDDPTAAAFAAAQAKARAEAERVRAEAERARLADEERLRAQAEAQAQNGYRAPDLSEKKPSENAAVFANPYLVTKEEEPAFRPSASQSAPAYNAPGYRPQTAFASAPAREVEPPQSAPAATFTSYYRNDSVPAEKHGFDFSAYRYPDVSFLTPQDYADESSLDAEVAANMERLIQTLKSYGVQADPRSTTRGPRVTRYEIVPSIGVRINTITNLQNEISMNLCAESLRIEAPIPGDSAVGIEVPNKITKPVRLRGLIDSEEFRQARSKTTIALGRDIAGKPVFTSIAEMPHMLVAGATGMGKSVCINTIITSLLYKARPDEVRLILVDPKMVEFNIYQGIPHLLVPVINNAKQALGALNWAAEEMDRRFGIISAVGARDLDGYANARQSNSALEVLPRIVIVIDELNDLILSLKNSKPLDDVICRIAQKARAAGIHLILGTQRPTVNVITGNIKANISARIAFHVNQKVDSTTIIDAVGAEKLLDKGDMLYMKSSKTKRIQCCLVDEKEIDRVVSFLRANCDGDVYDESAMAGIDRATSAADQDNKDGGSTVTLSGGDDGGHVTPDERKFWEAVEVTLNAQKASTSLLQRKLAVGYSRAAKFIDQMEELGIVGPQDEKKARELLMTMDEVAEMRSRLAGSGIFETGDEE